MTREKTITVTICDGCGKDCDYPHKCMECGKAFCYSCQESKVSKYNHAVHFAGSGDGEYCLPCETKMLDKPSELFSAYLVIRRLRKEEAAFYADFKARAEVAEMALKATPGFRDR